MGFKASPEQVAAFQKFSHRPGFSQEILSVDFTTTHEFIASVIPPGFEPADKPTGNISISTWESKLCGEFDCTMVSVACKWQGKPGKYILTLLVSGDMPVTWGREVWGEIKKTGDSRLFRSGNRRFGYGERRGVRLVELDAVFGEDLEPTVDKTLGFEVKAYPHSTGQGLQWEPRVITLSIIDHNTSRAVGTGTLKLRGSIADPLHTIPILSISDFSYVSGLGDYTVIDDSPLGCKDDFLPYLVGRHYDDLREYHIGSSFEIAAEDKIEQLDIPAQVFHSG